MSATVSREEIARLYAAVSWLYVWADRTDRIDETWPTGMAMMALVARGKADGAIDVLGRLISETGGPLGTGELDAVRDTEVAS